MSVFAFVKYLPNGIVQDTQWSAKGNAVAADRYTLVSPSSWAVVINGSIYAKESQVELDLSVAGNWDDTVTTDWTVASNRAGKDFYVYAVEPSSGFEPDLILSANSTYPDGYTADNSRKIGGFHCLCVDVGTITGHSLSDYVAGDILPASVWDLTHRPRNHMPEGMTYDEKLGLWVDIYLMSDDGDSGAQSVYGATILDTIDWIYTQDRLAKVGKRSLWDHEFQIIASGSNEGTNISATADPVTTGGHVDTASRRMISDIGCEDCCGAMWQWLLDQSYRFDGASDHTHDVTVSGDPETVTSTVASNDVAPGWQWYYAAAGRGAIWMQGTYGDAKLLAGNSWGGLARSGTCSRNMAQYRWNSVSSVSGRGCCEKE